MSGQPSSPRPPRLAVLGSGKGSNFVALAESIARGDLRADIVLVASDHADAGILDHARSRGFPAEHLPPGPFKTRLGEVEERHLAQRLRDAGTDLVILAGFMRVIKAPLLEAFPDRILNIHPSLLPAFKGLEAWRQALDAGATEAGCTVHLVNADIDAGRILAQARVPVLPGDTAASLHARIQVEEHRLFPAAIAAYWQELSPAPGPGLAAR